MNPLALENKCFYRNNRHHFINPNHKVVAFCHFLKSTIRTSGNPTHRTNHATSGEAVFLRIPTKYFLNTWDKNVNPWHNGSGEPRSTELVAVM